MRIEYIDASIMMLLILLNHTLDDNLSYCYANKYSKMFNLLHHDLILI
jgi:hypothetical protein